MEIDDGCTEARALEYMEGKRHAGNRMEDFYILLRGNINNHFRFIVFYATITLTVRVHSPISRCFCFNITAWAYGAYKLVEQIGEDGGGMMEGIEGIET